MTDTESIRTPSAAPVRISPRARLAFWWHTSVEIAEMTRDREREDRLRAEAAVRLTASSGNLSYLFRRRSR